MRVLSILGLLFFFSAGLTSCIHTHCSDSGGGSCGDLMLGGPFGGVKKRAEPSRWQLYTGIALESVALVSAGVAGSQLILANDRRDEATTATGIGERAYLLDQAESHERISGWGFGIGVPLAVVGGVFILIDVLTDAPEPQVRREASKDRDLLFISPIAGEDGTAGVQFGVAF